MQLQDIEKLRRLELMRSSIGQEGAAEIAQRLVDSIADERYRRYGLFILGQMFSQSGQMELAKSIAAELPNDKSALLLASMAREFAGYEPLRAIQCLGAASGLIEQEVDEFNQSAVQSTHVWKVSFQRASRNLHFASLSELRSSLETLKSSGASITASCVLYTGTVQNWCMEPLSQKIVSKPRYNLWRALFPRRKDWLGSLSARFFSSALRAYSQMVTGLTKFLTQRYSRLHFKKHSPK